MKTFSISTVIFLFFAAASFSPAQDASPIRFNADFPGASLGKIIAVSPGVYRCHIPGQYNECGRNRQTSWFYFRIDHARDRDVTLIMTDYIGEYNERPGAVAMTGNIRPFCSDDGIDWRPIETFSWDDVNKEATLRLRPKQDSLWIAHVPPYTFGRIQTFLEEIDRSPWAKVELIGESVQKRGIHLVTITDPTVRDEEKKRLWIVARQHAWETWTSFIAEGALRFLISDDPEAVRIRQHAIVSVVPTLDPDGCENGGVRFNRNGYDTNRHWSRVDLRNKEHLRQTPEIFYLKKTIAAAQRDARTIDWLVSLHNQETGDCLMSAIDDEETRKQVLRFEEILNEKSLYDSNRPKRPIRFSKESDTIEFLWRGYHVPTVLLEMRVERHPKPDRYVGADDFKNFGKDLVRCMVETVLPDFFN